MNSKNNGEGLIQVERMGISCPVDGLKRESVKDMRRDMNYSGRA